MNRRQLLQAGPATLLGIGLSRKSPAWFQAALPVQTSTGMITRMQEPRNLEASFHELANNWITPTESFYVRNHFPVPTLDVRSFRLTVEGEVQEQLSLSMADLLKFPSVTMPLTLECAGNGRVFLAPQARGLQWGLGGVGTANWTGIPLSAILAKAGILDTAKEVIFVGADKGAVTADPPSPGPIPFDRSIPLSKALKNEVLLAYRMNDQELTPMHGYPLRVVVGGWYGMASIKWLTRIIVTSKNYQGFWQTLDYAYFARRDGLPTLTPITGGLPKASIGDPAPGTTVPKAATVTVRGLAWAGEQDIAKVEFSSDRGQTWQLATLTGPQKPYCWRQWQYRWSTPDQVGPAFIVARATDTANRTQPLERDLDRRTYMINHLIPTEVLVR